MNNLQASSGKQLKEIADLKSQNTMLNSTVGTLNNKVDEQQNRILDLIKQNSDLSLQLGKAAENIYGNVTGGNSFCELIITPQTETTARMILLAHGEFPQYEINIRIVDLALFGKNNDYSEEGLKKSQVILNIGNMSPESSEMLNVLQGDFSSNKKAFNIFFSARNGFYVETLRLFKIDNLWKRSIKIHKQFNNELLYQQDDQGIPTEYLDESKH